MIDHIDKRSWTEYFRIISPFLLLVLTWISASINNRLANIEDKLFKHLTNDEIHCPRSIMVPRAEFDLITKMREQQIKDIKDTIKDEFYQLRVEVRNPQVYKREE